MAGGVPDRRRDAPHPDLMLAIVQGVAALADGCELLAQDVRRSDRVVGEGLQSAGDDPLDDLRALECKRRLADPRAVLRRSLARLEAPGLSFSGLLSLHDD